ncbi:hypothetical protein BP5796_11544 [Coleophoma crateriformis]|uniref:Transcription factor domain-containing protein n=1 Tax=Coleophoma crateriformis TaxID=565419 RepID=A0A3D8QII3_9HELO|nr:hypothetical protein BP5796_11544 [Coleophoma crateriformis]
MLCPGLLPLGPCSNCAKTGKNCTFIWLHAQEKDRVGRTNNASKPSSKRAKSNAIEGQPDISSFNLRQAGRYDQVQLDYPPIPALSLKSKHLNSGRFSPVSSVGQPSGQRSAQYWPGENFDQDDTFTTPLNDLPADAQHFNGRSFYGEESDPSNPFSGFAWGTPVNAVGDVDDSFSGGTHLSSKSYPASNNSSEIPQTANSTKNCTSSHKKRKLERPANISPFSTPERLAAFTNRSLITESLMRVYHDSLENALSCWLTERTCPYGTRSFPPLGAHSVDTTMLHEWGPGWSNRICRQVVSLDRSSAAIRDRPLTGIEDKAASKALNLAILAFATQWSQSSERSRKKFLPFDANRRSWDHTVDDNLFGESPTATTDTRQDFAPPPEFDRTIQESFWTQARQALQDAGHIESFRVVFAHIIFALTQRPLNIDQDFSFPQLKEPKAFSRIREAVLTPASEDTGCGQGLYTSHSRLETVKDSSRLMEELEDLIDHDGPPIFLEQGLRHIHSLRYKLNRLNVQGDKWKGSNPTANSLDNKPLSISLSRKDWKTVDMLYWLGVMFDTLSAAMHKRPLVVSDEDSDLHPEIPPKPNEFHRQSQRSGSPLSNRTVYEPNHSSSPGVSSLWESYFFQAQQSRSRSSPVRWPCSYEIAATALADAAPIKVLLFRKVTRIQTLLSRHVLGDKLENSIKDALDVYQYWNTVYGPFIADCVAHHDRLPARIQSWYICLTGHWHLAVLLLADIIQTIDYHLDFESHRRERESCGLLNTLRRRSTHAVADLARCSCPKENASFPDTGGFHFALNQGALLTEPWTQVLIRVFAKAGALLLADAEASKYGIESAESSKESLQRCEECVEALWYLGRKSDMAFLAAKLLTKALNGPLESMAATEASHAAENFGSSPSLDEDFSFSVPSLEDEFVFQRAGDVDFSLLTEDIALDYNIGHAKIAIDS